MANDSSHGLGDRRDDGFERLQGFGIFDAEIAQRVIRHDSYRRDVGRASSRKMRAEGAMMECAGLREMFSGAPVDFPPAHPKVVVNDEVIRVSNSSS